MPRSSRQKPFVAPVSTVLFIPNSGPSGRDPPESNIPKGQHLTGLPHLGTILLIQQPPGLLTAVLGDIMATRLHKRGVQGVVVDGRVRDIGPTGQLCAN